MTREGGLGKLDLPLSPSPTEPWEGALGFGRLEKGRGCLPETAAKPLPWRPATTSAPQRGTVSLGC